MKYPKIQPSNLIKVLTFKLQLLVTISQSIASEFVINRGDFSRRDTVLNIIEQVSKKIYLAYDKLGIKVKFREFPSARSVIKSNSGEFDAELIRGIYIEDNFSNLIRINVPLYSFDFHISCNKNISLNSLKQLKPYRFAYLNGILLGKIIGEDAKSTIAVKSEKTLFKLLKKNRTDCILNPILDDSLKEYFKLNIPFTTFHYIHKKHAHLKSKLEHELRKLFPIK